MIGEIKEAEKLYQIFVIDTANAPVYSSLVIAYNEMEAIKKAGINYDPTYRIFIRAVGYEYNSNVVTEQLKKYENVTESTAHISLKLQAEEIASLKDRLETAELKVEALEVASIGVIEK